MPRIEMTRTVRVALFALRVYLIVLLGLIVLSFVMTFYGPRHRDADEHEPPSAATTSKETTHVIAPPRQST